MFELVVSDGMEWSGMEPHSIVWFCKKRMEWNVMELIPSNTIHLLNFSFPQF